MLHEKCMFSKIEAEKIALLSGNRDLVNQVLGKEDVFSNEMKKNEKKILQSPLNRAKELAIELKTYLLQMVAEAEEYEDPIETQRLQSEAVGILISIREIIRHFPEVKENKT